MAITNPRIIDSIAKSNSKLLISNIEKYLRLANDSTQIKITYSDLIAPENIGANPTLKVNFSLQDDNQEND